MCILNRRSTRRAALNGPYNFVIWCLLNGGNGNARVLCPKSALRFAKGAEFLSCYCSPSYIEGDNVPTLPLGRVAQQPNSDSVSVRN